MPLVKVQAAMANPDSEMVQALLRELSGKVAALLGKPERYVMTIFETCEAMTFAGSFSPSCYVEIKSVGAFGPERTRILSREVCARVAARLSIPQDRIYIEFADVDGALWGWNGQTFG